MSILGFGALPQQAKKEKQPTAVSLFLPGECPFFQCLLSFAMLPGISDANTVRKVAGFCIIRGCKPPFCCSRVVFRYLPTLAAPPAAGWAAIPDRPRGGLPAGGWPIPATDCHRGRIAPPIRRNLPQGSIWQRGAKTPRLPCSRSEATPPGGCHGDGLRGKRVGRAGATALRWPTIHFDSPGG